MLERRKRDQEWKIDIETRISNIETALAENNKMTKTLLELFDGMEGFWKFCTKIYKCSMWIIKRGTVIAIAITAAYHALDAIASHDVGSMLTKWWGKR